MIHAGASLLGKVSSWLAPSGAASARSGGGQAAGSDVISAEEDPNAIHIFTVASGHMYERLQKIMVLSVLRTTKCAPPQSLRPVYLPILACTSSGRRLWCCAPPSTPLRASGNLKLLTIPCSSGCRGP